MPEQENKSVVEKTINSVRVAAKSASNYVLNAIENTIEDTVKDTEELAVRAQKAMDK